MILDIDVPVAVLPLASFTATGAAVDAVNADEYDPLTGIELLGLLQLDLPRLLACPQLSVAAALRTRGAVLASSGRYGISVGSGRVVEPCGRFYAITTDEPNRWAAAYLPSSITVTMSP